MKSANSKISEKKIRVTGVERDLNKLTKAGADPAQVLRLLALAVLDHRMDWRRVVKKKRDALKSLARRLRTVTEDAEQLAKDPLCGPHFWLALLGMISWNDVQWPAEKDSKSLSGRMMRRLAESALKQANSLGQVLRKGAVCERRSAVLALSYYIRKSTGDYSDDEVARLLVDAHEAIGIRHRKFSAYQLKKLRQRHMRGYDDCSVLLQQCSRSSELQSYRFGHSAEGGLWLYHGRQ